MNNPPGHGILRYTGFIAVSASTVEELDVHVTAKALVKLTSSSDNKTPPSLRSATALP